MGLQTLNAGMPEKGCVMIGKSERSTNMRNMSRQCEDGKRIIASVPERYDISGGEMMQIFKDPGIYEAVVMAFYAGVNIGHTIADRKHEGRL